MAKDRVRWRSSSPEYIAWRNMIRRCTEVGHPCFHNYGGRGIYVCKRWLHSFDSFLKDVGIRPNSSRTLERIDNNGNYESGNVCWATRKRQAQNTRKNKIISHNGKTMCLSEWARHLGFSSSTMTYRVQKHGPIAAVSMPRSKKGSWSRSKGAHCNAN